MKGDVNRIGAYFEEARELSATGRHVRAKPSLDGSTVESELADVLDEYVQKLEAGTPLSLDDLVARYPHLEEPIREYMPGLDFLNAGLAEMADSSFQREDGGNRELGDFELLSEIGRGGMGVVYEARQKSLGRTVALKILPFAAMLDQRRVVRFEAEARAAARLQHAHIVPVYAVGCDDGVHYYAMQLIDGRSIRDVIDANADANSSPNTSPRDVARLGAQVANALHAAHECGIVHRDIKPSNLLLDEANDAWITDFGLARCQTDDHVTRSGDVLGTLHYMSPEQAHGKSMVADPRSDVYSLGVTLYELLTSQRPFEGNSHAEVMQQIELGSFRAIRSHNPAVPRDLENVVAKAMSVEPTLRYQSAAELEEDLQRFVDGRATLAKPPSKLQLASRWAARNRTLVGVLATALALSCVVLASVTVWLANAKSELDQEHAAANEKLAATESTLEAFGLATAERLKHIPGSTVARKALLSELLTHYEDLLRAAENDPALREDRAITNTKIANLYRESGEMEEALEAFDSAEVDFDLLSSITTSDPNHAPRLLAKCVSNKSVVLLELGRVESADRECRRAIALQEQITRNDATPDVLLELASSYTNLASIVSQRGETGLNELRKAAELGEQAATISSHGSHNQRADALNSLSTTYSRLSSVVLETDLADAVNYAERAVAASRELLAADSSPNINVYRSAHATNCNHLAALLARKYETRNAAAHMYASAAEQLEAIEAREDLVVTLSNLGKSQSQNRDYVEAKETYQRAITVQAALLLESPGNLNHQSRLGGLYNNIALSLEQIGDLESACNAYESAIKYQDRAYQLAPTKETYYRDALSRTLFNSAEAFLSINRSQRAAKQHLRRSKLWPQDAEQLFSVAHRIAHAASRMSKRDLQRGKWLAKSSSILDQAMQCDDAASIDPRSVAKLSKYLNRAPQRRQCKP